MKNFLAIYRGEPSKGNHEWNMLSKEDEQKRIQEGMKAWGDWMTKYSSSIVFTGGPLGKTLRADKKGINPTTNQDCGYVIVKANSHEEAAKMFKDHPHFAIFPGECVEIMEEMPIPGL